MPPKKILIDSESVDCKPVSLSVEHIKQKYVCGCGLAALETVLKYYGAKDSQVDFLTDNQVRRQVDRSGRGLSEGTLGILALRRGFKVTIYAETPRLSGTYFRLGGRLKRVKTNKQLILDCLQRGVPPIVLIPRVSEAYENEQEEVGHYVAISGVDDRCRLHVIDPQYTRTPRQDYWDHWSSSLLEIKP
jgi:hypothetical protein